MTDTLGVCEFWGEGRCVIRREDGTTLEIATTDIVSGKPVPPRPSIRDRVSPRDAELHGLALWPSLQTRALGDWIVRHETEPIGRRRKRANSALAYGDPGLPISQALAALEDAYRRLGLPPMLQADLTDVRFADAGWELVPGGEVHLQVTTPAHLLRRVRPSAEVTLTEESASASATIDGVGVAHAALHEDWVGIHSMWVEPDQRRRGVASALLAELVDWAASRGATTAWLHVETANGGALRLYDGLGFRTHHSTRYWAAAASG